MHGKAELSINQRGTHGRAVLRIATFSAFVPDKKHHTIVETQEYLLNSAGMAACIVSYLDTEGLRHTVEVDAESLYEAAVLAVRTFRQHHCEPGPASKLEVEIRSSVTHTVTLRKIHDWLNGGARTPKEAVIKERLRALL